MLSLAQAQSLVEAYLSGFSYEPPGLVVLASHTLEKSFGWVFFYQSRAYIESKDPSERMAGNAPLIVNRFTGAVVETGTAKPIEAYVALYESSLNPSVA